MTTQTLTQHVRVIEPALEDILPFPEEDPSFENRLPELRRLANNGEARRAARLAASLLQDLALRVGEHILTLRNWIDYKKGEEILLKTRQSLLREYFARRRYAEALPLLETLLKNDGESTGSVQLWYTAALRAGEPRKCLEVLSFLVERNPMNWAARDAAREVLGHTVGDYEKALQQTLALLDIFDPKKGFIPEARRQRIGIGRDELLFRAGEYSAKLGRLEDAYDYYQKSIVENPDGSWGKQAELAIHRILPKVRELLEKSTSPTESTKP